MAAAPPDVVVVMGVSGAGKSTVGRRLAERLGAEFVEGDDLHPPANVAKMAAGEPLDDADRWPWLDAVGTAVADRHRRGRPVVASCSALRRRYRDRLRDHAPVRFVLLEVDPAELDRRTRDREHRFMPSSLLASQLAALERVGVDEDDVVVVEVAGRPVDTVVDEVASLLAT